MDVIKIKFKSLSWKKKLKKLSNYYSWSDVRSVVLVAQEWELGVRAPAQPGKAHL